MGHYHYYEINIKHTNPWVEIGIFTSFNLCFTALSVLMFLLMRNTFEIQDLPSIAQTNLLISAMPQMTVHPALSRVQSWTQARRRQRLTSKVLSAGSMTKDNSSKWRTKLVQEATELLSAEFIVNNSSNKYLFKVMEILIAKDWIKLFIWLSYIWHECV